MLQDWKWCLSLLVLISAFFIFFISLPRGFPLHWSLKESALGFFDPLLYVCFLFSFYPYFIPSTLFVFILLLFLPSNCTRCLLSWSILAYNNNNLYLHPISFDMKSSLPFSTNYRHSPVNWKVWVQCPVRAHA